MLNINQNFDLKAPVFNFDRDYFNSVEELNAYDTSNVPNHFVTNVAGMLYQFTDGAWIPMIGTINSAEDDRMYFTNIGSDDIIISTSSDSTHVYNGLSVNHSNGGKYVSLTVDDSGPEVWLQGSSNNNRANIKIFNDAPSLELTKDGRVTLSASPTGITATSDWTDSTADSIKILTNKELTQEEQDYGYSPVDISLTDGYYSADINARHGFMHKTDDGFVATLNGYGLDIERPTDYNLYADNKCICINNEKNETQTYIGSNTDDNYLQIGSDEKFKILRPADNTEGATITGVKSLTAFANPSATKVWATDGSTVDLTTKANASDLDAKANKSDVLLKKSDSGGYYVETNYNQLGSLAFAANRDCTASGNYSFAEGGHIKASGIYSHAEGVSTEAIGTGSHAEGNGTKAQGNYAHAEGETTKALGDYSHAEGQSTTASGDFSHAEGSGTDAQNGSHAEGNYTHAVGLYTHAEGEYTSASGAYSHAEGFATRSNGDSSHSEGYNTNASGYGSHAQGIYNVDNAHAIHSVGIGNNTTRKNAEYIYAKNDTNGYGLTDDPKNGYKYLIGVGGYDGISTDNSTYKSVQEVIADLTARIEQLETKVRALEAANTPA